LESSRKLAERLLTHPTATSPESRIQHAFKLLTARTPTQEELTLLKTAYTKNLTRYQQNPQAAQQLLKIGESPINETLNKPELAAWTMISSILLNLDEVVTKN
jgi:hypothetical protein